MPYFRCEVCGVIERCSETYYWVDKQHGIAPRCSAHHRLLGTWHGKFPQRYDATGMLLDRQGELWYPEDHRHAGVVIVGIVTNDDGRLQAQPLQDAKQPHQPRGQKGEQHGHRRHSGHRLES